MNTVVDIPQEMEAQPSPSLIENIERKGRGDLLVLLREIRSSDEYERDTPLLRRIFLVGAYVLVGWVLLKKRVVSFLTEKMPRTNSLFFDGSSLVRDVKESAGTWRALDIAYNYTNVSMTRFQRDALSHIWLNIRNAKAVRNRLRLVKRILKVVVRSIAFRRKNGEVRILELAAGSAQGLIEVARELRDEGIMLRMLLVDKDPTALAYAEKLALEHGVQAQFEVADVGNGKLESIAEIFQPDIIEVVGLIDYYDDRRSARLFKRIFDLLPPSGVFLTANIMPNPERRILHVLYNWPKMFYRTEKGLISLFQDIGFASQATYKEPLNVYCIGLAYK